jgi:hypothetical protein
MPGPQVGIGRLEVAERWLAVVLAGLEDVEAAATPATTTDNAKMRMASFIFGYPFSISIDRKVSPVTRKWYCIFPRKAIFFTYINNSASVWLLT